MLCYELYRLRGLVSLGREEYVGDVAVPALPDRAVVFEALAGVQLASGIVHVG